MAYIFRKWTLYEAVIDINQDVPISTYFFSRWPPHKGKPSDMPEGYKVGLSRRTGLPFLKEIV